MISMINYLFLVQALQNWHLQVLKFLRSKLDTSQLFIHKLPTLNIILTRIADFPSVPRCPETTWYDDSVRIRQEYAHEILLLSHRH